MSSEGRATERIAARVADGLRVDWERELAAHPEERDAIQNLRWLAELAADLTARDEDSGAGPRPSGEPLGTWGHLRLVAELGSGSFGTVYRAFDPVLQREVALKLRRPRPGERPAAARAFLDEARRLARVRHPHVLGVHGASVHDGRAGLWADLLTGGTLEDEVSAGAAAPLPRILAVGEALAAALAAVHQAGLVHGDVKAGNVAVEEDGRVVLVDFGAAADLRAGLPQGAAFASPLSAAPERLAGEPLRPAADLYGLGVVLYRLASGGRYPLAADTLDALLSAHGERGADRAPAALSPVPRPLRKLLADLLAPDPSRRPSASAAAKRLRWIREAPSRRRRRIAVAVVVASLAGGTVAATLGYVRARRSAEAAEAARAETEAINAFLTGMLAAPRPTTGGRQVLVVDVLDNATERLASLSAGSAARARVGSVLGLTYTSLRRPEAAVPLLREAAETISALHGPDSDDALEIRSHLADALAQHGDTDAARRLALDVVAAGEGRDPVPFGAVFAQVVLARLERSAGEPRAAEQRLWWALEARSGPAWELDRGRLLAEIGLANAWLDQGRFAEAAPLLETLVERLRVTEGERNADTLGTRNNLAIALAGLGRHEESAVALRRVAEVATEWLGEDDRYALVSRLNLAAALKEAGHVDEAFAMEEELVPTLERVIGPTSPFTLSVVTNHCLTMRQLGRVAAAEHCSEASAGRVRESLGDNHPVALVHAVNRAELFLETGRPERALELARDTRERMAAAYGEGSPFTLAADTLVGAGLAATGRPTEGIARLRTTLAAQRALGGPEDLQALTTQLRLGQALRRHDREEEGRAQLAEALALARDRHGAAHPLSRSLAAALGRS